MIKAAGSVRPARKTDAPALAELLNMAGHGLPYWLWQQSAEAGQDPLVLGALRAAREQGGFSYRNAWVVEQDEQPVAMLLSYRLDDPYETGDLSELPEPVRPAVLLESQVPGSWYINALATYPQQRGRGHGKRLLDKAELLAKAAGATRLSLIVEDENYAARRLYERLGFVEVSRQPLIAFGEQAPGKAWLLLVRELAV